MPPRKDVVFNYYTVVSDDLITSDPHSGQYTTTFKSNIQDETGKVCGTERRLLQTFSTVPRTRTQMCELDLEEVGC